MPMLLTKLHAMLLSAVYLLTEAVDPVSPEDWQPLVDAFTAQINVTTIVAILAGVMAACLGLVFFWWGVRKAIGALMTAFKKGKLKI
ncbi:MAG: hypothetical protein E7283_01300 [Lachnospiraceae bacterium]|nr:hypothetical protein [Lachnospiraceae bacterium]